jgi:hypothetical protein
MLTEIYIEALLVDKGLADQVWEARFGGEIMIQARGSLGDHWLVLSSTDDDTTLKAPHGGNRTGISTYLVPTFPAK